MTEFLQQLINGLALGSIYALIALGYTMVYGVLRFINFAHGDIFMVGAFAGLYLAPKVWKIFPEQSIAGALCILVIAMLLCAALGMLIESIAYKPLRGPSKTKVQLFLIGLTVGLVSQYDALMNLGNVSNIRELFDWSYHVWIVLVCGLALLLLGALIDFTSRHRQQSSSNLNVLITAIGVSLLIEYVGQHEKVFGASPQTFPQLLPSKQIELSDELAFGSDQLIVLAVTALLLVGLQFIVQRTRIGAAMRAVSFNADAASLMGINTNSIISFTFGLGSALAAAGGILYAMNYPSVDPLMGILPGLKAFVAAVLGGIGSIPGAALGGLILGVVETFVAGSAMSTYRDAIAFAILIAILLFKPSGLFGRTEVEKV